MWSIRQNTLIFSILTLASWLPDACAGGSNSAIGTTGAQFLELPVGAREIAMGGAGGTISQGAAAIYYNPAGLAGIKTTSISLTQALYFQNIYYQAGSIAGRLGRLGNDNVYAVSVQHLSPGTISEVDNTGTPTGSSLAPRDLAVAAGIGKPFGVVDVGLAGKYITSKIDRSASTLAIDLGFKLPVSESVSVAGSQSNIGVGLKYHNLTEKLPALTRLGAAFKYEEALGALDLLVPGGAGISFAAGAEYPAYQDGDLKLLVRAGYNSRASSSKLGGLTGFSAGTGFNLSRYFVDYAFMPFGELGSSHWVSLVINFGDEEIVERRSSSVYFSPGSEAVVYAGRVKLYRSPDKKSRVVAELRKWDEVEVDKQVGDWVRVTTSAGKTGWLHKTVLKNKQ